MSLGFSVSDIGVAISLLKRLYNTYSKSPNDYKAFCNEVDQLHHTFEMVQDPYKYTHWSTGNRTILATYTSNLEDLLKDLSTFVKKYESLANGGGRTRDRVRWSPQDVDEFRRRILGINTALTTFILLVQNSSRESSDRESYESSLASDEQTLNDSLQYSCDPACHTKRSFFDVLGSSGSSLNAGFGGGSFIPSTRESVKGIEASTEVRRTFSAGEADQPKPRGPKKHSMSFSLGSSSPSLAQVRSPFGQGSSRKPST